MALTSSDIARLADLARIDLTDEELETLVPQLGIILEAVERVAHLAGSDIACTSHPVEVTNVMRDDVVADSLDPDIVLGQAPDAEDQQIRVPKVLGE